VQEENIIMATWFITGCSTGLGRSLAEAVLGHGDNAVITARDISKLDDVAVAYPDTALAVTLDVTDPDQISSAIAEGTAKFGGINVLVNNAGYGYRAAVEEFDADDVHALFATHFFGTVQTIKAVLPQMRERRSGTIINLSSIGARINPPGSGFYSAAKAAIEGMTGSLRKDLEPLGIVAFSIEPGGFRTDFGGRSLKQSPTAIADYADTAGKRRIENSTEVAGWSGGDPDKAAQAIITVVESGDAPQILSLGSDSYNMSKAYLNDQLGDLEKWRELSESTDFSK
jgi:NAD(P)-dependent dehydrogenase (short-subunit alcohol dehydrogenase family)